MGRDKAEITYGDQPQWRAAGDLLAPFCKEVYWSCSEKQKNDWGIGSRGLMDKIQGHGPASGLQTAFSKFPDVAWIVVACDYPFLESRDIEQLVNGRELDFHAVTFVGDACDGKDDIQPMLTLWEPAAQRQFLDAFDRGEDSPRRILKSTRWKGLSPRENRILSNINSVP
jgi:molybdopterin-guanine dinucleotide biosynthesis protein A